MGHVDHGKTKLLDAIRDANVVAKEAGGITQHIGAYQVSTEVDGNERRLTFIDTPGHEAFTAMRMRGAQATDIAILVVAADDGVMPQTIEALNHAKAADVPIVVAVNKIDKPEDADPTKVRGQLTEYGLVPEEYGGDTMFVDVSAKSKLNIDKLLESIVLTADAALDLRANPDQDARVSSSRRTSTAVAVRWPRCSSSAARCASATRSSPGPAYGRVRAMLDEHGESVEAALPSRPVMVLGLTAVPGAGDNFLVVADDRVARQIAEKRDARERAAMLAKSTGRRTLEDFMSSMEKGESEELLLILKGDGSGSVEALEDALSNLDVGEDVNLRVIDRGVGAITETNVMLAAASNAIIIGFNVRPQGKATEVADREGVDIRYYSVIYQAIDEIEAALKGMLKPEFRGGAARHRRDPRGVPVVQDRQHRRLHGHVGHHAAQRQGAAAARRHGGRRQPRHLVAEAREGRRHRGPRGLRVWSDARRLQRHQDRRCDRDVRNAGDSARPEPAVTSRHAAGSHPAARLPGRRWPQPI